MLSRPDRYRDIRERSEARGKPGVFGATPVAQARIAAGELRQTRDLLAADMRRSVGANSDAVHQAVPAEPQAKK